jgi:hypothetical protein
MPPIQTVETPTEQKFYLLNLVYVLSILLTPTVTIFLLRNNLKLLGKDKAERNAT